MNDPSCYEDWCDAVQARAAREDKIAQAADHLRMFLAARAQGYSGDVSDVEKALALLSPAPSSGDSGEGTKSQ